MCNSTVVFSLTLAPNPRVIFETMNFVWESKLQVSVCWDCKTLLCKWCTVLFDYPVSLSFFYCTLVTTNSNHYYYLESFSYTVIPVRKIHGKAALLEGHKGKSFVARVPNRYEKD